MRAPALSMIELDNTTLPCCSTPILAVGEDSERLHWQTGDGSFLWPIESHHVSPELFTVIHW